MRRTTGDPWRLHYHHNWYYQASDIDYTRSMMSPTGRNLNIPFPCHVTSKLYCVNYHLPFVSSEVGSQLADVLFLQWKYYGVETIKSCYNRLYKTYVSNRMFPSSAKFLSSRTKAWSRRKLHVLLRLISSIHVGNITPVWDYFPVWIRKDWLALMRTTFSPFCIYICQNTIMKSTSVM